MYDYFSKRMGYVIDDVAIGGRQAAFRHLMDVCGMSEIEADSYLDRIRKAYLKNVKAAKEVSR